MPVESCDDVGTKDHNNLNRYVQFQEMFHKILSHEHLFKQVDHLNRNMN